MPKDTKTLCIKKGCASVLTQPLFYFYTIGTYQLNKYICPVNILIT